MATIQEAVKQATAGEPIDTSYLEAEPVDKMADSYALVFRYFAAAGSAYVRLSNFQGLCSKCAGRLGKLIAKVPGAVRFDGCCSVCGEDEFHTAGWSNDEAGDAARRESRVVRELSR